MSAVIEVDDFSKDYADVRAVDHLSFTVESGTITGFLGPNGSGKTTTLRALLGLVEPTSGTVRIAGSRYRDLDDPLRHVGAMLESSAHPARTARNHLRVVATEARMPRTRVDEVLELVELTGSANRRVGTFSLGMHQRLGLATALISEPGILVLDEPANGLDPQGIRWLRDFLRSLADEGHTILLSSHVLAEVAQTVDHVVVIDHGRIVADEPLDLLMARNAGERVHVRSSDQSALRSYLQAEGAHVSEEAGALVVTGVGTDVIGRLAFDRHVVIYEMAAVRASLEDTFLELTTAAQSDPSDTYPSEAPS
ncbi:ABC transporter ATP-binding protein [Aeromicrobium sp. 9AM]|uniref:ABC transporter ATP-binding protein n=1 Tax=Aeromicrobium sp. 9AM TaxID=2653126 RepID=UPI0012EFD61A|nr:ATP-binding cassette domain-containing protein [Aeromicrobium sp. 9AM]VXB92636.1 ABC transporter ATP-binding protein [Aeromicrobium sp. 9AM]